LVPLYLKTTYKNDPMFKDSRSVFTLFDSAFAHQFTPEGLYDKVKLKDVEDNMLSALDEANYNAFLKIGIQYADAVVTSQQDLTEKYQEILHETPQSKIRYIGLEDNFAEKHLDLYTEILG
jgi:starch synthase